jgi:hypothetical protein
MTGWLHAGGVRMFASSYPDHVLLTMPALSPTMEHGNIASWEKAIGDEVGDGDVLAEIETDKATVAFESAESGYMARIFVPAGTQEVPVGELLAIMVEEEEDIAAFADYEPEGGGGGAAAPAAPAAAEPAPAATPAPAAPATPAAAPAAPAAAAPGVLPRVHIDGSSRFFLSLFACSGRRQFHRRGNGPFEYCHEEPFDAIPDLTASKNGRSLVYAPAAVSLATAARPGRLRDGGGEPTEEERRPFLLHSNGKHYRMKHKALAPIIEQLLVRNASIAAVPELDATPVLLVDLVPPASRKNRPCSVGSLGSVLRGWQRRTVVPDA